MKKKTFILTFFSVVTIMRKIYLREKVGKGSDE